MLDAKIAPEMADVVCMLLSKHVCPRPWLLISRWAGRCRKRQRRHGASETRAANPGALIFAPWATRRFQYVLRHIPFAGNHFTCPRHFRILALTPSRRTAPSHFSSHVPERAYMRERYTRCLRRVAKAAGALGCFASFVAFNRFEPAGLGVGRVGRCAHVVERMETTSAFACCMCTKSRGPNARALRGDTQGRPSSAKHAQERGQTAAWSAAVKRSRELRRARRVSDARAVLDDAGVQAAPYSWATNELLAVLLAQNHPDALALAQQILVGPRVSRPIKPLRGGFDTGTLNLALRVAQRLPVAANARLVFALHMIRRARASQAPLNAFSVSCFASLCMPRLRLAAALAVKRMAAEASDLDTVAYTTLVELAGKAQRTHIMETLFAEMMRQSVAPNVRTFCAMMRGYMAVAQYDNAMAVWKIMRAPPFLEQRACTPDAFAFGVAAELCARTRSLSDAQTLASQLSDLRVTPDAHFLGGMALTYLEASEPCETNDDTESDTRIRTAYAWIRQSVCLGHGMRAQVILRYIQACSNATDRNVRFRKRSSRHLLRLVALLRKQQRSRATLSRSKRQPALSVDDDSDRTTVLVHLLRALAQGHQVALGFRIAEYCGTDSPAVNAALLWGCRHASDGVKLAFRHAEQVLMQKGTTFGSARRSEVPGLDMTCAYHLLEVCALNQDCRSMDRAWNLLFGDSTSKLAPDAHSYHLRLCVERDFARVVAQLRQMVRMGTVLQPESLVYLFGLIRWDDSAERTNQLNEFSACAAMMIAQQQSQSEQEFHIATCCLRMYNAAAQTLDSAQITVLHELVWDALPEQEFCTAFRGITVVDSDAGEASGNAKAPYASASRVVVEALLEAVRIDSKSSQEALRMARRVFDVCGDNADTRTFCAMICLSARALDTRLAVHLVYRMRSLGKLPSPLAYQELVDQCIEQRRLERAIQLFADAVTAGSPADVALPAGNQNTSLQNDAMPMSANGYVASRIIRACGREGRLERAAEVFQLVLTTRSDASHVAVFNAYLYVLGMARRPADALLVFQQLQQHAQLRADAVTYSCLASVLLKNRTPKPDIATVVMAHTWLAKYIATHEPTADERGESMYKLKRKLERLDGMLSRYEDTEDTGQ
ncbi:Pentatricopeptide repeat-containing protein [Porphyridium purpureum]|uniref:Pentatricopeptide repeat-containing protein n=1 Tax=Porphyridium purpureum TaxID=35688 RepID=A0A5J4YM89_PORPP|nr:Pentatricopeptide repeat-containing protein [Porphyridium purpureum]|eukprot:POR8373..scf291_13